MENISLRKATIKDHEIVVGFDYRIDSDEHIKLNRKDKLVKAILDEECFIIVAAKEEVGFVLFNHRFFDQGWIELIIVDEAYRGRGIGAKVFELIGERCQTVKLFTSTNSSNTQMQKALKKADFTFAGTVYGLDDGDPELFYYKRVKT